MIASVGFAAQSDDAGQAFFLTFVILMLVLVLAGVVWWVRRKLSPDEDFHAEGFNLSDLRRLHKSGQMSDEEYERAKAVIVGGLKVPPPKPQEPQIKPDPFRGHRQS